MHNYLFQELESLETLSHHVEQTLFHQLQHVKLQGGDWKFYGIVDQQRNLIVAFFPISISASTATSPKRSPFGSIIMESAVPEVVVIAFIDFVEADLREARVDSIRVTHAPALYFPEQTQTIHAAFMARDYTVTTVMSAVQVITDLPFESRLHYSERKRLRKSQEAGFVCKQLSIQALSEVYDFLYQCRSKKGYSLSLTKQECLALSQKFPENILLFGCFDQTRWVAAAIVIKVTNTIFYDFYHDHDADYDQMSPVVALNGYMYEVCQQEHIRLFDLGTSMTDDTVNQSLLDFKLKLGATLTPKYTFTKRLSNL